MQSEEEYIESFSKILQSSPSYSLALFITIAINITIIAIGTR